MIYLIKMAYSFILPPGLFLLMLAYLTWRMWKRDRRAAWIPALSLLLLYLLSASWFSDSLLHPLEHRYPQPDVSSITGDVIVVLGGGAVPDTRDLDGNGNLLGGAEARLLAAVRLSRMTNLPILFSGGQVFADSGNEANIAGRQLRSLGIAPDRILLDNESLNTIQNAVNSKEVMRANGLSKPILITSAFHMQRSMLSFRHAGLEALPFPVDYMVPERSSLYGNKLVPSSSALSASSTALKEYIGIASLVLNPRS